MSRQRQGDWIRKYGHLTIEKLKDINFTGQGQIQQHAPLWQNHLVQRGQGLLDDLKEHPNIQLPCPQITITRLHYNILQRYHKQSLKINKKTKTKSRW